MTETEEYFPRGGKKPTGVFKQSANFLGTLEKSSKKKRKPKKKGEGDDGYLSDEETREIDQSYKNCAVGLSLQIIKEGVLVLGRVYTIHETKMQVMLPCRLMGTLMACHISEPYNKLLEDYVNDKLEKVPKLSDMFKPGQYIAVKVLEVKDKTVMLSTMPQHLNSGKLHADIVKGALFQAAVSSVEDHGYVMDLGISNTRAFLPKKDANPEVELIEGKITWCSVKSTSPSAESCIVTLSNGAGAVQGAILKRKPNTALLPGTAVEFTVDTPLDNGIEGTIFGDTTCYIQRQHADKIKGKKPALGQKIRARVLYVMPTRNTPFLTMKDIFSTTYPDLNEEQKLKDGDIVDDAQVLRITGRSIHFKLGADSFGTMSLKRVQIDEDLTDEEIVAKSYPIGSVHKVRILCYNLSDYIYSVSDQPELLNEKYFNMHQLVVGETVQATVVGIDEGIKLQIGRVHGYVPKSHITETGVYIDPKKGRTTNIQKKYKVGQTVTARILVINPETQSVLLTLKPSLLAPDLDVLATYEDAVVGKAYVGVIRFIRDYLLVTFFNNVTAFVPRNFVTQDKEQNLAEAFHLGQIVTCTIINVNVNNKKMTGSLTTAPFSPDKARPRKHKLDNDHTANDDTTIKRKRNNSETSETNKKKDKSKQKNDETEANDEHKVSEESDAIETDFNDEEQILTPHEQGLVDLSDCNDIKDYKKRTTAILKAIQLRNKRLKVVNDKIESIEEKGLNAKNKKFHTAMHTEKLLIEERINKLQEVLSLIKEKKNELTENFEDYKIEQKKRKKERAEANKQKALEELKLKEEKKQLKEITKQLKKEKKLKKNEEQESMDIEDAETEAAKAKNKSKKEKKKDKTKNETEATEAKTEKISEKDKLKTIIETDTTDVLSSIKSLEPALEVPSVKDFWSTNVESSSKTVQEEESSSSDDEQQEQPKKKRKKLSVAEKLSKLREEEDRVRRLEAEAASAELQPRSVEHFERALLAHPASSQMWIAYMAFHLQSTELEKARAVARKALNTIPFREEHEKLNVWIALLNLEHRFGTKESQQKTLEEALQLNEPYKIHTALLDILIETGKQQDLASLSDLMVRKYKRERQMYIDVGRACYKMGLVDKARQVMQKAMNVLEKKEHVSILVQFALLERSHGARERSEALFEQVLAVYPQRVDVTCVYVDMLVNLADIDSVRQVMERMTSLKLPARKMKVLYKKWIEVEEKIGDETHAEKIKQRAMEFIDKAKF